VILLVSVSARMLAELATRDGYEVMAFDRFGDLDLRRACPSVSLAHDLGPGGMETLVEAAERVRAPRVVYGAGLENRPDLVARLAEGRTLLGCSPGSLRRVRDHAALGASLREAGFPFPRTFAAAEPPHHGDAAHGWLRKPVHSGGGRGVRPWRGGRLPVGMVVQERIRGVSCSAAAVANERTAALLGVSEQLAGRRAFGARAFKWCGNVVPPRLAADERRALGDAAREVCAHVAAAFGLRGVFGVDLVWDGERAWVLEVNPRPVASLEVVAAAHSVRPFAAHLDGCAGRLPPAAAADVLADPPVAAGKAVLFATRDLRVPDTRSWPERGIRDVPHPGEAIAAGHPICTLVATGDAPQGVLAELEARAAALRGELHEEVGLDVVA
jgi:uncharacterized protein